MDLIIDLVRVMIVPMAAYILLACLYYWILRVYFWCHTQKKKAAPNALQAAPSAPKSLRDQQPFLPNALQDAPSAPKAQPSENPDITFQADDGSMHLNVGWLDWLYESHHYICNTKGVEKAACSASGLPAEQVQREIRAWIESHLNQEDLRAVPNGIPVITDRRFAIKDPSKKWEDRYHPFFLEHAPDPEASIRQVLQYKHSLSEYGSIDYLCVKGRVSACESGIFYGENTDSIRLYDKEPKSTHEGGAWWSRTFELTCSDEPETANNGYQTIDFPNCELAYRDGDSVLLHRPFLLDGWYRLRDIDEGGDLYDYWYWHNNAMGEIWGINPLEEHSDDQ